MSQIEKYEQTAIVNIHTGEIEIEGQKFQLVPLKETQIDHARENDRINAWGWIVLGSVGIASIGLVLSTLAQAALQPLPAPPQTVIVAPAPNKTCIVSILGEC